MTEETKKTVNSKQIFIITAVVVVVILITAGIFFLRKTEQTEKPPQIGQIDRDKVTATKAFKDAEKKVNDMTEEYAKKFEAATKGMDENKEEDQKKIIELRAQYQQELMQKTNQLINPLWKKAAAAVAIVAVKKEMNTVFDKRILVCGATDITDEVIALMESGQELAMPDEKTLKALEEKSKVAYFDKNVVLSLNMFSEAQGQLAQLEKEAKAEYEKKSANMNDEQKAQLLLSYKEQISKAGDDLLAPMFRQVNRTVKQVAQDKKLSLVVNKESVMFGGRNITDEVADELSGKKKSDAQ